MEGSASVEQEKLSLKKRIIRSVLVIKEWTQVQRLTSAGLYLHILAWGIYGGAVSSMLLDLEQITSTTSAQIGFMFAISTLVGLIGAPLGGQILAILDTRIVLAIACCSYGCALTVLPWARNFTQLISFAAIVGLIEGALVNAQNITTLLIWGWNGFVYMQGYHGTYAIGTFIGPWLAAPFLSPTWYVNSTNGSQADDVFTSPVYDNVTVVLERVYGESKIMYVYMIIGIYFFLTGIVYVIFYVILRKQLQSKCEDEVNKKEVVKQEASINMQNPNQKKLWYVIPMTVMASLRFGTYVGLEITFSKFLMTYAVKGLGWEKMDGLKATTFYWGSFAASRILGTFVAMFISPTVYIIFDIVLMAVAFIGMTFLVRPYPVMLLVFSVLVGVAHASFYGCSMSWLAKYMHITPFIGSAYTTGSYIGMSALPALAGYLIEYSSPSSFLYMCLFDTALLSAVTLVSTIMGLKYGAPIMKLKNNENLPPDENQVTYF